MLTHDYDKSFRLNNADLKFSFFRGHGPGGQHKNKTDSAVRLTHKPTGIVVIAQYGRKQGKNKELAVRAMRAKLFSAHQGRNRIQRNSKRRNQVGRGSRGEKVRTYCEKKDLVVDHRTNKRISFKRFFKGYIKDLH